MPGHETFGSVFSLKRVEGCLHRRPSRRLCVRSYLVQLSFARMMSRIDEGDRRDSWSEPYDPGSNRDISDRAWLIERVPASWSLVKIGSSRPELRTTHSENHMNTSSKLTRAIVGAVAMAALSTGVQADRNGSGTWSTDRGASGTYSGQSERSGNSVNRSQTVTTEGGKTFSRSSQTEFDRQTGEVNSTVTGPGGRTRTSTGSIDREEGTLNRTITGQGGRSVEATTSVDRENKSIGTTYSTESGKSVSTSTSRNEGGGRSTTVTGPGGKERSVQSTTRVDRDAGTATGTMTGPGGRSGSLTINPGD